MVDHAGAPTMYLLGFVNSTFETRRPSGNLELLDLSLEKKYHPPEQTDSRVKELAVHHLCNGNVQLNGNIMTVSSVNGSRTVKSTKTENGKGDCAAPIMKPSIVRLARPRRPSMEDLPPDLYMEPLCSLVLRSPEGKKMPVFVLERDIASSKCQELDQEWSFWDLTRVECQKTSRTSTIRLAPGVLPDGRVATRLQHHPLETTQEDQGRDTDTRDTIAVNSSAELACEDVGRGDNALERLPNSDEGYGRLLQHLERIEGTVKDLKTRVDDAKLRIEQSEQSWGIQAPPITTPPRDVDQVAKAVPSLSNPVMEKMAAEGSPELPFSWNKKVNLNLESEKPVMEERDLRYSPPIVESDVRDAFSFRLWEQESSGGAAKPKRCSRRSSVSKAFEDLDLETALDLVADEYAKSTDLRLHLPNTSGHRRFRVRSSCDSVSKDGGVTEAASSEEVKLATKKPSPPSFDGLLNLKAVDLRSRREKPKVAVEVEADVEVNAEVRRCEEASQPEDFNPSPCSFTCGLSPTSLFSDDQEPFQTSVSSDEIMFVKNFCHAGSHGISPRSVLSPKGVEPDESSHSASESSETREDNHESSETREDDHEKHPCAYLYHDESSDLESPVKGKSAGATAVAFPAFTYSVGKEMAETSSSSEEDQNDELLRDDHTSTTLENASVADLAELRFFQEATNDYEPWLVKDGDGVLDESDLEFLLSPCFRLQDTTTSLILRRAKLSPVPTRDQQIIQRPASEEKASANRKTSGSPKRWLPYVTGELQGNDVSPARSPVRAPSPRHEKAPEPSVASVSAGTEKAPKKPAKRSVNFAPDLVKEIPYSPQHTVEKRPASLPRANSNVKHRHEDRVEVSRSGAKAWDVEEEGPSIMTSRRRWRRNREPESATSSPGGSSSWGSGRSGRRRDRVAQVVPCAGKMFSWPQKLAFKVSRGKAPLDSDEKHAGDGSFGMSARRDAEQVKRILKGSQKKYSNLTVDEIMKEDFTK